jgi:glucose-6-phosphate 1-epimerase
MVEIELWNGVSKAVIDPRGAWLTNLSDNRGDVLFPRRLLKTSNGATKQRGGCHVCLPNFGPGGTSSQPQHGFGREMDWKTSKVTTHSAVLTLDHGRDGYENLASTLQYTLGGSTLRMTLEAANNGKNTLRVAPAFHPYFAISGSGGVRLNDEVQSLDDLAETVFVEGTVQHIHLPNRYLALSSRHLPLWAQWTDQLGPYICVEPTVGGYTFLQDSVKEIEVLQAGQHKTYTLDIKWS